MKKQTHEKIKNADNLNLGVDIEDIHIEGITDSGAREIDGFVITQHELFALAKYWMREHLNNELNSFYRPNVQDIVSSRYAARRLVRIKQILGFRLYGKATREAREHFFSEDEETEGDADFLVEHQKIMKSV
jgi:hypothetical protein